MFSLGKAWYTQTHWYYLQSDDYEDEATEEISDTDSSDESMSGFIVDDTDTVEGEDPQEDYFYTQSIDQQQVIFPIIYDSMCHAKVISKFVYYSKVQS